MSIAIYSPVCNTIIIVPLNHAVLSTEHNLVLPQEKQNRPAYAGRLDIRCVLYIIGAQQSFVLVNFVHQAIGIQSYCLEEHLDMDDHQQ